MIYSLQSPHQSRAALGGVNDNIVVYDDCVGTNCLWRIIGLLWENNAPAALHTVGGKTGAPTRGAYIFFCFAMRVVWRLRRDILLVRMIASYPRTAPTNRVPLLVELMMMASSSTTASVLMVGYGKQKACRRPLRAPLYLRPLCVAPQAHCFMVEEACAGAACSAPTAAYQQDVAPQAPERPDGKTLKICSRRRRPCIPINLVRVVF